MYPKSVGTWQCHVLTYESRENSDISSPEKIITFYTDVKISTGDYMEAEEILEKYAGGQRKFQSINLRGVELKGADLKEIDFYNSNLTGSDLSEVDLTKARINSAYFNRACLINANLGLIEGSSVNLSWADISGANLSGANLSSANLSNANLDKANLSRANLSNANLGGASLIETNFSQADLSSASLENANLQKAKLRGVTLEKSNLSSINLADADLVGVYLGQVNLKYASLQRANLERASLLNANLIGADFDGANLKKANLIGANIYGATFRNADLTGAIMPDGEVYQPTSDFTEIGKQQAPLAKENLMTRQVIRTDKAPAPVGPYNQAILASGQMLFVAGQIAIDPRLGDVLYTDDVTKQTEQVMANLEAILTAAGATFEDVVKTTVFLADMKDFAAMNAVYAKYFSEETAPARACVQAARLPKDVLVEIECIAVIGG